MSQKRTYYIMLGISAVLVLCIIGVFVGGDLLLRKQSGEIAAQKLQNAVLDKEQLALTQAKLDLDKYADLEKVASQVVPQEKDQARTTREIVSLAQKAGVSIASIGFPSSSLGSKPTSDAGVSGSPTSTSNAISQAKPVSGIPGLLAVSIVVTSDSTKPCTYDQLIAFLSGLENNRRTAQVTQISIQPDSKNNSRLNFNLTLTVYIKP